MSDLNIGRRNARTNLAQDLAHQYASTLGDYQTNAVNAGNQTANASGNNQLSWLQQLMGYGQQGFNNDLNTARFNADQNNTYQDFLLKMLSQGYGGANA